MIENLSKNRCQIPEDDVYNHLGKKKLVMKDTDGGWGCNLVGRVIASHAHLKSKPSGGTGRRTRNPSSSSAT